MRAAFIYSDVFSRYSHGSTHPLKPFRLKLTYELILACGLLAPDDSRLIVPVPATKDDLITFHTRSIFPYSRSRTAARPLRVARSMVLVTKRARRSFRARASLERPAPEQIPAEFLALYAGAGFIDRGFRDKQRGRSKA